MLEEKVDHIQEEVLCSRCKTNTLHLNCTNNVCPGCGALVTHAGQFLNELRLDDKLLTNSLGSYDLFKLYVIREWTRANLPWQIRLEMAVAIAFGIDSGYCDFEQSANIAREKGWLCPWDGRLHRNEECDRKAVEFENNTDSRSSSGA